MVAVSQFRRQKTASDCHSRHRNGECRIGVKRVAFAKYSGHFIAVLNPNNILLDLGILKISTLQVFAISSIVLLTYINSKGINYGKILQLVFTSAKLIALFFLIVAGFIVGSKTGMLSQNFNDAWAATQTIKTDTGAWVTQNISGMSLVLALGTAIIGSLFSSDSWNNVTFIAGEMKNPRRNIHQSFSRNIHRYSAIYCC